MCLSKTSEYNSWSECKTRVRRRHSAHPLLGLNVGTQRQTEAQSVWTPCHRAKTSLWEESWVRNAVRGGAATWAMPHRAPGRNVVAAVPLSPPLRARGHVGPHTTRGLLAYRVVLCSSQREPGGSLPIWAGSEWGHTPPPVVAESVARQLPLNPNTSGRRVVTSLISTLLAWWRCAGGQARFAGKSESSRPRTLHSRHATRTGTRS